MSYFRRNHNNGPREITAKFDSTCAETGEKIKKGSKCLYFPDGKKVYSMDSKEAQRQRENNADEEYLNNQMYQQNGWVGLAYAG